MVAQAEVWLVQMRWAISCSEPADNVIGVSMVNKRFSSRRRRFAALIAASSIGSVVLPALGQTFSWLNPVSGVWLDSSNWSSQSIPQLSGDNAVIAATGSSYTVTLQTDNFFRVQINNLLLNSP